MSISLPLIDEEREARGETHGQPTVPFLSGHGGAASPVSRLRGYGSVPRTPVPSMQGGGSGLSPVSHPAT
jgi:hypothetical protein